jgi:hypothetical protein
MNLFQFIKALLAPSGKANITKAVLLDIPFLL